MHTGLSTFTFLCVYEIIAAWQVERQVQEARPAVAALVGILLAVAAVALGVGHYLTAAGALQHFCTAGTQVLPEASKLQHDAAC